VFCHEIHSSCKKISDPVTEIDAYKALGDLLEKHLKQS
jgi:hypothetical protein